MRIQIIFFRPVPAAYFHQIGRIHHVPLSFDGISEDRAFIAPTRQILYGCRPHPDIRPAIARHPQIVGTDDVSTVFPGVVRIFKHPRLAVRQVFPQGEIRISGTMEHVLRLLRLLRRRQSARDGRESRCKQAGSHSPTFKNHLHFFHFFYFVFSFKGKRQNDIHSRPFPFPSDLFFQYFLYFHRSVCQVAATDDDTLRHVAWTNSASGHVEILFIFHSSRAIH